MTDERNIRELEFERDTVNLSLLHQQLKVALGEHFVGVSHGGQQLRVHLYEDIPKEMADLVAPIVLAHDPAGETDSQKREKEETALLDTLKGKKPTEWKPDEKDRALEVLLRRLT